MTRAFRQHRDQFVMLSYGAPQQGIHSHNDLIDVQNGEIHHLTPRIHQQLLCQVGGTLSRRADIVEEGPHLGVFRKHR